MQAAHDSKIALLDITQDRFGYGHAQTSAEQLTRNSPASAADREDPLPRALERRTKSASSKEVASLANDTSKRAGSRARSGELLKQFDGDAKIPAARAARKCRFGH
jgi:hypothetical protein